jgi:hypothetical protein
VTMATNLTESELTARAAEIRAQANAAHAQYPHYAGHWDNWTLMEITRKVQRHGRVMFERGEVVLVSPEVERERLPMRGRDLPYSQWPMVELSTAYSVRSSGDVVVRTAWLRKVGASAEPVTPETPASPLVLDLKRLCVGRGVHHPAISGRLGPDVRAACGVLPSDGPDEARRKVIMRIGECAGHLPLDTRVAALAMLAIHPDAQMKFTQERLSWLAKHMGRNLRTARRRAHEGFVLLAELLTNPERVTPRRMYSLDGDLADFLAKLDAVRRDVVAMMAEQNATHGGAQ